MTIREIVFSFVQHDLRTIEPIKYPSRKCLEKLIFAFQLSRIAEAISNVRIISLLFLIFVFNLLFFASLISIYCSLYSSIFNLSKLFLLLFRTSHENPALSLLNPHYKILLSCYPLITSSNCSLVSLIMLRNYLPLYALLSREHHITFPK